MIEESERSTLFEIPEDKSVDSADTISIDSCFFEGSDAVEESTSDSSTNTSLLQKLSSKLHKSSEGGADVMELRGIYGADFEGYASVTKRSKRSLGGLLGKKNVPKQRFLLIKGAFLFVFKDELSASPRYIIRLAYTKSRVVPKEDATDQDVTSVIMETPMTNDQTDLEYELVFQRENYANGFVAAATQMAEQGEMDEIPERLGSAHLLTQPESMRYAEKVAMETMDDHPTDITRITLGDKTATYLRTPIGTY